MSSGGGDEQVKAEVVRERALTVAEVGERVRAFLKRRRTAEQLSNEDFSRLQGLQEALLQQEKREKEPPPKKKTKRSRVLDTEPHTPDVAEPDRKKRRRRSDVT